MSNEKQEYLMLFRSSNQSYEAYSPEELQQIMGKIRAWFDGLGAKGILKGGQPLEPAGRTLTGKGSKVTVSDGPFAESKETVGGYTIILADSLDEATEIAKGCPSMLLGGSVEVRAIADECPLSARLREMQDANQLAAV